MSPPAQPKRWIPYLLILLVPLLLVFLEAYAWVILRPQPASFALQGFVPRVIAAEEPLTLKLLARSPQAGTYHLQLEQPSTGDVRLLPATLESEHWQTQLPALPAGHYRLSWQAGEQPVAGPALTLQVRESRPYLLSDKALYAPGEHLVLSVRQLPVQLQRAEVKLFDAAQRLRWQTPVSLQQGAGRVSWVLPADLPVGAARVVLSAQGRVWQTQQLGVYTPGVNQTQGLQLWPASTVLAEGLGRQLQIFALNPAGLPVTQGWVQAFGKSFPIQAGQATLDLPEGFRQREVAFAAGDSQGNLAQGSWPVSWQKRSWQADYVPQQQLWQLSAAAPQDLHWALLQAGQLRAQGLVAVGTPAQPLAWPDAGLQPGPATLLLRDQQGLSQHLHWWVMPQVMNAQRQPLQPHALQPVSLETPALPAVFDITQYQLEGFGPYTPLPGHIEGAYQAVGFETPAEPHPLWLSLWLLLGLGVTLLPVAWLAREIRSLIRAQRRPFPSAVVKRSLNLAQRCCEVLGAGTLLLALLAWLPVSAWWLAAAALWLGLSALVLGLCLKPLSPRLHRLLAWLPLIQALLVFWALWFVWTYQPGLLAGLSLWSTGLFLGWWWLLHKLGPSKFRPQRGMLLLATLTVLVGLNLVWVLNTPQRLPVARTLRPVIESLSLPYPQTRLLHHQAQLEPAAERSGLASRSVQLLPTYAAGSQWVQIRTQTPRGEMQTWQQSLAVAPAVLAELQLPRFALQGDRLVLPLNLRNPTRTQQDVSYALQPQAQRQQTLSAGQELVLSWPWVFGQPGWNHLKLWHTFAGERFERDHPIYVQVPVAERQHPHLRLSLQLPKTEGLVPGEEIPVLVQFEHHFASPRVLGLQLGVPAGFGVLAETLQDRANTRWLEQFEQVPGYLNLRTQVLQPGEAVSFHFRLQAGLLGEMGLPNSRLFDFQTPEQATVLSGLPRLSVLAP